MSETIPTICVVCGAIFTWTISAITCDGPVCNKHHEFPERCPICYASHENMTYCRNEDTNNKWICKNCYLYGNSTYYKILFGEELTKEELDKVSEYRMRSLEKVQEWFQKKNKNF